MVLNKCFLLVLKTFLFVAKFMIDDLSIYNIFSLDDMVRLVKFIKKFRLDVLLDSNNDL